MNVADPPAVIELRLDVLSHLFDPFDPFPLPSRDLAKGAEDFIVGWARELPKDVAIRLVVHVPQSDAGSEGVKNLPDAIRRHFTYRADRIVGDLHELLRIGRLSLAIGVAVLVVCVAGGRILAGAFGDSPLVRVLAEGLLILGWVANWRPMEIFLYEWWPLLRRRRLYQRIASASVTVRPDFDVEGGRGAA
jgi:hypothetical protein